jgi:hypothetical protein
MLFELVEPLHLPKQELPQTSESKMIIEGADPQLDIL